MNNNDKVIQLFDNESQKPVLFEVTNCLITNGIQNIVNNNIIDEIDINIMLLKHMKNIDDNKKPEDSELNLQAIKTGSGRVLSVYEIKDQRIYINSYVEKQGNKTVSIETTVMLCEEY